MMRLGSLERVEYVVVDRTGYVELNLAADHNRCGRIVVTFGRRRQTIEHLVIRRTSPFPAPQRLLEVGDFPLVALGLN